MRACNPVALLLAIALAGCSGTADGPVIGEADRATGVEQHPQLLAEFGGAYDGDEAVYLKQLGGRIAAAAELEDQCNFTLVNSDVVNAFAVPGCYIYVTRGLMGIVNSEAELGAVLAHEVGHIVARHSQRQQRRSLWRMIGVVAVSVVTGSEQLTRIAGAAAGLFTLRYSRKQEYEADDLGLRYLRDAGLDPHASADMLEALGRHERFQVQSGGRDEARSIPEWARTHPLSGNRAGRARDAAAATGLADDALPEHEARFLGTVDGLLYGDDPRQGFVTGRRFAHPIMRIAFEAPPGFTLTNSPQAILIEGPDGMRGEFGAGAMPAGGLAAYSSAVLERLLRGATVAPGAAERVRINGLDALVTRARVDAAEQSVTLTMVAYDAGASVYHFIMLSNPSAPAPALDALFGSFRLIGEDEVRQLRPRIIRTVRVAPAETAQSLARRMASSDPLAHFLMLNGLKEGQSIAPGAPVKIVVYASN